MEQDNSNKAKSLSAQELYQIAKKNEMLNRLRKARAEEAALEAFNLLADAMQQWTGNRHNPLTDDDLPFTDGITLPDALRRPVPKNAFGTPIYSFTH